MLALAAGGALMWWRRRSSDDAVSWGTSESTETAISSEPPKLGGDVDAELLEILADPLDKQPVTRKGNFLVGASGERWYPIRDGIPVMLIDEALTEAQARALPDSGL